MESNSQSFREHQFFVFSWATSKAVAGLEPHPAQCRIPTSCRGGKVGSVEMTLSISSEAELQNEIREAPKSALEKVEFRRKEHKLTPACNLQSVQLWSRALEVL